MTRTLLDPNFGMFTYYEESRLLWFNRNSFENTIEYELIGIYIIYLQYIYINIYIILNMN